MQKFCSAFCKLDICSDNIRSNRNARGRSRPRALFLKNFTMRFVCALKFVLLTGKKNFQPLFIEKFIYYVGDYRSVFNVGGRRSEAERGIDYAPPVVACARAEFDYQRVVNALLESVLAVNACGEIFAADFRAGAVVVAVRFECAVADLADLGNESVDDGYRAFFVDAFADIGSDEFDYFVLYFIFNVLVGLQVGVCADVNAQVVGFRGGGGGIGVYRVNGCGEHCDNKNSDGDFFHSLGSSLFLLRIVY